MPVSGPSTYLSTIDAFLQHWLDADAAVGPPGIVLVGGYNRAALVTDRATLATKMADLETLINARELAGADRDTRRAAMGERIRQFGAIVRGQFKNTVYRGVAPRVPNSTASGGVWGKALDDMANGWSRINTAPPAGFTPPLLLAGGYNLATFNTDATALKAAFTAVYAAFQDAETGKDERDAVFLPIRARLAQYRGAIQGRFAKTDPIYQSLPLLYPPAGRTPLGVPLTGEWADPPETGRLTWGESTDPDLDHYSVRYSPGTSYKSKDEEVVASVPPGTLTYDTLTGLAAPGSQAWFKVYVVLTTANEKGSNAVKIVRP